MGGGGEVIRACGYLLWVVVGRGKRTSEFRQGQNRQGSDIAVPRAVLPERPDVLHGLQRPGNAQTAAELQAVVRVQAPSGERVRKLLSDHVPDQSDRQPNAAVRSQRPVAGRVQSTGRRDRTHGNVC